ncbi:polyprenyl synthetase family protein [Paenibacillus sp. N4]|nr:polyprenyl synthetase family protein [Paenibacillus vietnamensis]MCA0756139.1 polyprenyl synthetase family protein [Paenibacillus vietnamensis]
MLGGKSPNIAYAAAQTELIILSLDIMDDLQDQDNLEPPWMQCDTAVAMNCASNLLVAGLSGIGEMAIHPKILKLLSSAHNGQHQDLSNQVTNEEQYLSMVSRKSSSLINLAMQMGYQLLDHKDPVTEEKLDKLADCIGIAAQLQNDLKEIATLHSRNDLVNRKKTLTTLYLLDLCESKFPILKSYYEGLCSLDELAGQESQLADFISQSGVFEYTYALQRLYMVRAKQIFESLPAVQPWSDRFLDFIIHPYLNKI